MKDKLCVDTSGAFYQAVTELDLKRVAVSQRSCAPFWAISALVKNQRPKSFDLDASALF